jgi:hypothetical protein
VGFVMEKVALGQVLLEFFSFIPPSFSILIYHVGDEQWWQQFGDVYKSVQKRSTIGVINLKPSFLVQALFSFTNLGVSSPPPPAARMCNCVARVSRITSSCWRVFTLFCVLFTCQSLSVPQRCKLQNITVHAEGGGFAEGKRLFSVAGVKMESPLVVHLQDLSNIWRTTIRS